MIEFLLLSKASLLFALKMKIQIVTAIFILAPLLGHYFVYKYYTDPSGTFWQCNAKAIGSGSERADSSLQEQYNKVDSVPLILLQKAGFGA